MILCILSLIVFGILGLFSAKYRRLAKEAFKCVFRRLTFRKCETKLDERIKAKILSKVKNVHIAKFLNKYIEVVAWIFVILFVSSMVYSGVTIYNLAKHGSCNPKHPEECVFSECKYNLESFVECLNEKNVKMYGAWWCPHCQNQKKLFDKYWEKVNYIECYSGKEPNRICIDENIEGFPTWDFNGTRISGELSLEEIANYSGCSLI